MPGGSISYDAAGNLTQYLTYTLTYDAENRLTRVTSSGGAAVYEYDGDGRRVRKLVCTVLADCLATPPPTTVKITTFVYDPEGMLAQEILNAAAAAEATPAVTGLRYLTADPLGSVRLQTDSTGAPVQCFDYAPFGELLNGAPGAGRTDSCFGSQTQANQTLFTGQYRDKETEGIDFFEARFYASAQGRFLSPDAPLIDQDPSDPQSWNLYAYVRNNPLSNVDPSGTTCIKDNTGKPIGDDGDGKGCPEVGVAASEDGKFDPTRDVAPHGTTAEAQMPDTLLTRSIDLFAGASDSFAFGLGSTALNMMGLYVNTCSTSYSVGEWGEFAAEVALTGGSAALKAAAGKVSRKAVRNAAEKEMSRQGINVISGTYRHHRLPLFGHPGGAGALFPTGGLPASLHSNGALIKRVTRPEHTAAHAGLKSAEKMLESVAMNPTLTGARAVMNLGCR